jgi:hypothetical protein
MENKPYNDPKSKGVGLWVLYHNSGLAAIATGGWFFDRKKVGPGLLNKKAA